MEYYPVEMEFIRSEEPPEYRRWGVWRTMSGTLGGDRGDLHDVNIAWDEEVDDDGDTVWRLHVDGNLDTTFELDEEQASELAYEIFEAVHASLYPGVSLEEPYELSENPQPKAYDPQEGYRYQILCRNQAYDRAWEHCDYAVDPADKKHLVSNYRDAYGAGWEFKTIMLPQKYWPKVTTARAPNPGPVTTTAASLVNKLKF